MQRIPMVVTLMALIPVPILAQGWIEPDRPVIPARSSPAIVRVSSTVRVSVDGRVARYVVEERFRNTGNGIGEGTYFYPLPGEAVFSEFSLFQGETELKGEMMNAEQARAIYEGIVQRLKDPALLTLAGHGLIRAQVFPVQPGETRTVILRFTQLLPRDGDAVHVRYAAGDRGDAPVNVTVDVAREAEYATTYSPTHPVTETRRGGTLRVTVTPPVRGDIDLVLPYRRGLVGGTILTHAEPGDDGFALLFLAPPAASENTSVLRDLTLVVDISGSMSGEKMDQARRALHQAIDGLRAGDRFRVIAFSNAVRQYRTAYTPVTPAAVADAHRFVDALSPNGGTNLEGAITAALALTPDPERMALVFLLTDGLPSVGEQAPDRIAAAAAGRIGRHRIFTVGVGQDVNTYLLDRLAVEGRGSATYVAPGADVGDAIGTVMTRMSRPALIDLRIVSAPVRLLDAAPAVLPDLFFGEELVVLARYRGHGNGPVVIEGSRNGRRERFTLNGNFAAQQSGNDYIPPLWAARRIGELGRQLRLEGSTPTLIAQIRDLGLRYGILTEYTSYLVLEPGVMPQAAPVAVAARDMTGKQAFDAAKSSAAMSASGNLSGANRAVEERMDEVAASASARGASQVKRAGGRVFALRNGTWIDVAHRDQARITVIAPFSRAYFDLVAARPTLAAAFGVGTPLLIGGQRASVRVADGGQTAWAPGALDRFLRDFEGR